MLSILSDDIFKIFLSVLLSALIGLERERLHKPAGLRTVIFVCLGTTLFTIVGYRLVGYPFADLTRILHAPIVGIGFLGGGVIMKNGKDIEGITTAALLWIMVAVGLLCGIGDYYLAILSTLIIYVILLSKYYQNKFKRKRTKHKLNSRLTATDRELKKVQRNLEKLKSDLKG